MIQQVQPGRRSQRRCSLECSQAWALFNQAWLLIFGLLLSFIVTSRAFAAESWQLLILSQPADQATATAKALTSDSQSVVKQRAEAVLLEQLANADLTVYDRRLVDLPGCLNNCTALDDIQLAALARNSKKAVDAVLLFDVDLQAVQGAAVTRWQVRVPAFVLELETGRRIESWDGAAQEFDDVPANCTDSCLEHYLAGKAAQVAVEVATVIAEKLKNFPRTHKFELRLQDFAIGEYQALEQALLPAFNDGYSELKLLETTREHGQLLHQVADKTYRLTSQKAAGSLEQQLRDSLQNAGASASFQLEAGTREFTIKRQGLAYSGRYLGGMLLLILTVLLLVLHRRFAAELSTLQQLVTARRYQSAQQHLAVLQKGIGALLPAFWWWQRHINQQLQRANATLQQLELALNQGRIVEAQGLLQKLQAQVADLPASGKMQQRLQQVQQAEQLWQQAQPLLATEPLRAAAYIQQAQPALPYREDDIASWLKSFQSLLQNHLLPAFEQVYQQSDSAMARLSLLNRYLAAMGDEPVFSSERLRLSQLQQQVLAQLPAATMPLCLQHAQQPLTLWPQPTLEIARKAEGQSNVWVLAYQRLSRAGKQVRLSYQHGKVNLEDLHSANGSFVDGKPLLAGNPLALERGNSYELALGGSREPQSAGLCRILLRDVGGAWLLKLSDSALSMFDTSELKTSWPALSQDLISRQLWLCEPCAIGLDGKGQWVVGSDCTQPVALLNVSSGGLYLDVLQEHQIWLDDVAIAGRVPLPATGRLRIGTLEWQLQPLMQ